MKIGIRLNYLIINNNNLIINELKKYGYNFTEKELYYKKLYDHKISNLINEINKFDHEIKIDTKIKKLLNDWYNERQVYIYTSPSKNLNKKIQWVENNLGNKWLEKLIVIKDVKMLNLDYLIDNRNINSKKLKKTNDLNLISNF